jgi:sterol desaturase/sphingolipid hydroxylase (fatty acid hydroxylase superfamily)
LDSILTESSIRLACFICVLIALALAEMAAPRRRRTTPKPQRWASNLGLAVLNTVAARLLLPIGAVGMAALAETQGWGLFNYLQVPAWMAVVLAVILLDLAIYLQHVLFHAVPVLWRLHKVHHADLDVDVSTGVRFHTIEILISLGIKLSFICLLGAPALGVLIFEILLNATSMFNHSNLRLPGWLDAVLRLVLVTPDMHRVHHSANAPETNTNFGFNLPWWDFLLGTYCAQPEAGHERMTLGLAECRDPNRAENLLWMLALPFVGQSARAADAKSEDVPANTAAR